jgi:hypothetical protein
MASIRRYVTNNGFGVVLYYGSCQKSTGSQTKYIAKLQVLSQQMSSYAKDFKGTSREPA